MESKVTLGSKGVAKDLSPQPKTPHLKGTKVKKTSADCLQKLKPNLSSKWMVTAMVILAIVGLGVAGAGAAGFFAQQQMLPAALAKLNVLGAVGHAGSIAMMAGGGVLTLVAIGILIAALRKACAKKKIEKQKTQKNKTTEAPRKTKTPKKKPKTKIDISGTSKPFSLFEEAVPKHLTAVYGKLNDGEYTVIDHGNKTFTFVGKPRDLFGKPVVRENVAQEAFGTTEAEFKDFEYVMRSHEVAPPTAKELIAMAQDKLKAGEYGVIDNKDGTYTLIAKPSGLFDEPIAEENILSAKMEELDKKYKPTYTWAGTFNPETSKFA